MTEIGERLRGFMATIIPIDKNTPHTISEVVCLHCLRRWIAARPDGTRLKDLECQTCGKGCVIETGEELES